MQALAQAVPAVQEALTPEQAAHAYMAAHAELGRGSLLGFTMYTNPKYMPNWHHAILAKALDQVLAGTIKRLMVFMPPQNGKSELVSRRFPAYALGKKPDLRIVTQSYGADLASEMSADVQKIIAAPTYRALFPDTRLAGEKDDDAVRQAMRFGVPGHDGQYLAVGVGGAVTGKTLDIGIIDDPHKNREEAESEAMRKKVWNAYTNDLRTRRRDDNAAFVLTMTRWHADDLAGRLLRKMREEGGERWVIIDLQAVCDVLKPYDPRKLGDALWPQRFSAADLEQTRKDIGSYSWSALYQQRPSPPGGAMFKRDWFGQRYSPGAHGTILRRCRGWDLAATEEVHGTDPDWTVGTLVAQLSSGKWLVEHVARFRRTPGAVDAEIKATAQRDGRRVLVREEMEGGASGKSVIASHTLLLAGWDYEGKSASGQGAKQERWRPFAVQCEAGNVVLPTFPAEWEREWLDELVLLPHGALHDDQGDSVAIAFNALAEFKDLGPTAAVVLPGDPQVVSGPTRGAWREQYFRR